MFMEQIDQREKTIVFCATQAHALAVRDLINQTKTNTDPNYCQRVTANDGALGEQHLRDFQDNEKTIPTKGVFTPLNWPQDIVGGEFISDRDRCPGRRPASECGRSARSAQAGDGRVDHGNANSCG